MHEVEMKNVLPLCRWKDETRLLSGVSSESLFSFLHASTHLPQRQDPPLHPGRARLGGEYRQAHIAHIYKKLGVNNRQDMLELMFGKSDTTTPNDVLQR